jgi:hypothetical protein
MRKAAPQLSSKAYRLPMISSSRKAKLPSYCCLPVSNHGAQSDTDNRYWFNSVQWLHSLWGVNVDAWSKVARVQVNLKPRAWASPYLRKV